MTYEHTHYTSLQMAILENSAYTSMWKEATISGQLVCCYQAKPTWYSMHVFCTNFALWTILLTVWLCMCSAAASSPLS